MRSRYSAYYTNAIDYLVDTTHPSKRQRNESELIARSNRNTTWLGLEIIDVSQGAVHDDIGFVEFIAKYRNPQLGLIHERSEFVKDTMQWYYLSGHLCPATPPSRNDTCWCGSGKKYKKCHGR